MGNYASCADRRAPGNGVRVASLDGKLMEFERRVNAAELMLEHPNHFVCHSRAIHSPRRRISAALSADEDLDAGHLYFLLPMRALHSALSPSEASSLFSLIQRTSADKETSRSSTKKGVIGVSRGHRVQPLTADEGGERNSSPAMPAVATASVMGKEGEERWQFRMMTTSRTVKQWTPALETISESPQSWPRHRHSRSLPSRRYD